MRQWKEIVLILNFDVVDIFGGAQFVHPCDWFKWDLNPIGA